MDVPEIAGDAAARCFWSGPINLFMASEDLNGFYLQRARSVCDLLSDLRHGARVLDLGCGSGILSAGLAGNGAKVLALDLSPEQLERARARCRGLAVDLRLGGMEIVGRQERFEAVCAIGVLPYIADQPNFVASLCGHVDARGWLVISRTRALTPFVMLALAGHLARFQWSARWLHVALNLARTGIWSGGFVPRADRIALDAKGLDAAMRAAGFERVARFGLFNIEMLDRRRASAPAWIRSLSDRLGWSIVAAYRRL